MCKNNADQIVLDHSDQMFNLIKTEVCKNNVDVSIIFISKTLADPGGIRDAWPLLVQLLTIFLQFSAKKSCQIIGFSWIALMGNPGSTIKRID